MEIGDLDTVAICRDMQAKYSGCDIADALLKLHVKNAGFLPDMLPVTRGQDDRGRLIAPLSTVILIAKDTDASNLPADIPEKSNIPKGTNWTDFSAPGTIVVAQQPSNHISAILGDIMVTRLKHRGVAGVLADGRIRDISSCCNILRGSSFQLWSKGVSAAGPSIEAKPWAVDVAIEVGGLWIQPGDFLCLDREDQVAVVIPREHLQAVHDLLPVLKEASDGVLRLVQAGKTLPEAVTQYPKFYSNYAATT